MNDIAPLAVGGRAIGLGQPVFVIAELSANHGGKLDRALELVELAAQAGADAVKLQTYRPETMTIEPEGRLFRIGDGSPWTGRRLVDLYAEAQTPWEWHAEIFDAITAAGMVPLSTPFDSTAVDFLVGLGCPVLKIASFELVDLELITYAAGTRLPLILSTGMATIEEIDEAVAAVRAAGSDALALLRCNSSYPARPDQMDLRTIPDMFSRWRVPVGLSDHTLSPVSAVAAVALGACIVEKHITRTREEPGPDSDFSLEPDEFAELVAAVRDAERSVGRVRYGPSEDEKASLAFRRSLHATRDIAAGELLTRDNVGAFRPAAGLAPRLLHAVLGRPATVDIPRGTPLTWESIDR